MHEVKNWDIKAKLTQRILWNKKKIENAWNDVLKVLKPDKKTWRLKFFFLWLGQSHKMSLKMHEMIIWSSNELDKKMHDIKDDLN